MRVHLRWQYVAACLGNSLSTAGPSLTAPNKVQIVIKPLYKYLKIDVPCSTRCQAGLRTHADVAVPPAVLRTLLRGGGVGVGQLHQVDLRQHVQGLNISSTCKLVSTCRPVSVHALNKASQQSLQSKHAWSWPICSHVPRYGSLLFGRLSFTSRPVATRRRTRDASQSHVIVTVQAARWRAAKAHG
jgi:hypothetical protein